MRTLALVCLLVTGCDRLFGIPAFADALQGEPGSVLPDGGGGCATVELGKGIVSLCAPSVVNAVQLAGTFDTSQCAMQGGELITIGTPTCVVFGTTITVATLRAIGTRPLVLAATDTITIDGDVDGGTVTGSAFPNAIAGPGGGVGCSAVGVFGGAGNATNMAGGGGAGGGFQGMGGNGANGGPSNLGGPGGPGAMGDLVGLRGGCSGLVGGDSFGRPGSGGRPGIGGGVLYFIAKKSISITGSIRVGGGGGGPGKPESGAGGGGAGGLIALDTPMLQLVGMPRLCANGGGGGGGGLLATAGNPGDDACTANNLPASGGTGSGSGGAGGDAANLSGHDALGAASSGGGGGGGAAGYVQLYGGASAIQLVSNADVSPQPTN